MSQRFDLVNLNGAKICEEISILESYAAVNGGINIEFRYIVDFTSIRRITK